MEDDAEGLPLSGVSEAAAVNLLIIAVIVLSIAVGVTLLIRILGNVLDEMSDGRDE